MKTRIIIAALAASYTLTLLPRTETQAASPAVQSNANTQAKAAKQPRLSKRQQRKAQRAQQQQKQQERAVPGQNVARSAGNVVEDAGGFTKDVVTSPQNVVQDTGTLTKNVLDDATSWLPWRNKNK